jgi:hypothetical protein
VPKIGTCQKCRGTGSVADNKKGFEICPECNGAKVFLHKMVAMAKLSLHSYDKPDFVLDRVVEALDDLGIRVSIEPLPDSYDKGYLDFYEEYLVRAKTDEEP